MHPSSSSTHIKTDTLSSLPVIYTCQKVIETFGELVIVVIDVFTKFPNDFLHILPFLPYYSTSL